MTRGTMMISDLSVDLESEILSRIPTTSLSELRYTCKRWYTLFKDPKFVKKNLGKAAREVKVIVQLNLRVHSIRVNLHGIHNGVDPYVEFKGQLSTLKDSKDIEISQIFHCDGLILCSMKGNESLVVWNPCTGETKWIEPKTCYNMKYNYALGFENNKLSCHSYKILRFFGNHNDQNMTYEIYELSSDSLRVLEAITLKWIRVLLLSHGVTLKENSYWITGNVENGFFMQNFDLTRERFGCFPLPFQSDSPSCVDTTVLSVFREEQLSLIHQNLAFPDVMRIWVTNKIDDETKEVSWSKFFVVDFAKFNFPSLANVLSLLVDEEQKMVVFCNKDSEYMRIFIVGEDIHREVHKEIIMGSYPNWPFLVSYVPSLVQIQKKTSKGKRKRNTIGG